MPKFLDSLILSTPSGDIDIGNKVSDLSNLRNYTYYFKATLANSQIQFNSSVSWTYYDGTLAFCISFVGTPAMKAVVDGLSSADAKLFQIFKYKYGSQSTSVSWGTNLYGTEMGSTYWTINGAGFALRGIGLATGYYLNNATYLSFRSEVPFVFGTPNATNCRVAYLNATISSSSSVFSTCTFMGEAPFLAT